MTRPASSFAEDAPDLARSRRSRVLLLIAAALTIGAGIITFVSFDRPRPERPDLQLRGTLEPTADYEPPMGPRERLLVSLEQPMGGRP